MKLFSRILISKFSRRDYFPAFRVPLKYVQQPNTQWSLFHPLKLVAQFDAPISTSIQISPFSSSPSSPRAGSFAPPSAVISHLFSQLSASNNSHNSVELQYDYVSHSRRMNSISPSNTELLGNDFGLSTILPIELGLTKCSEVNMLRMPTHSGDMNEIPRRLLMPSIHDASLQQD